MPSLVSIPPNIMTAAFETISGSASVAAAVDRTPRHLRPIRRHAVRGRRTRRARRRADLTAGRHAIDRRDDLVVPAEDDARLGIRQLERAGDDVDGQGTGKVPTDLGFPGRS